MPSIMKGEIYFRVLLLVLKFPTRLGFIFLRLGSV